jgi:hypothetical protein
MATTSECQRLTVGHQMGVCGAGRAGRTGSAAAAGESTSGDEESLRAGERPAGAQNGACVWMDLGI